MLTSLYVDKKSFVHDIPSGFKILWLLICCTALFAFDSWSVLAAGTVMVLVLYLVAKIEPSIAWASIKPILWAMIIVFVAQYFLAGLDLAFFVVLRFLVMLLMASLVTLTTKTSDLIEGIEKGLRIIPNKVLVSQISLAISLCIRFIPRVRDILEEVRNAQKARGIGRDWRALAVPTIVRTLKSADEISEAIIARSGGGVDREQAKRPVND